MLTVTALDYFVVKLVCVMWIEFSYFLPWGWFESWKLSIGSRKCLFILIISHFYPFRFWALLKGSRPLTYSIDKNPVLHVPVGVG